jgi:uncharacterized protein (TIGR00106 family)
MWARADISVVPLGVGVSLSEYVAACVQILRDAGLNPQLHAFGTNVEGNWEILFAALARCHEEVHRLGAPRVATTIRLSTRTDRGQTLGDKVQSVQTKMASAPT